MLSRKAVKLWNFQIKMKAKARLAGMTSIPYGKK